MAERPLQDILDDIAKLSPLGQTKVISFMLSRLDPKLTESIMWTVIGTAHRFGDGLYTKEDYARFFQHALEYGQNGT